LKKMHSNFRMYCVLKKCTEFYFADQITKLLFLLSKKSLVVSFVNAFKKPLTVI
jgi:hypothetical protein